VRFITQLQKPSDINPNIKSIPHNAAPYLHRLAKSGIPAPSTAKPWSPATRREALRRGAHSSATHQFRDFLIEDMKDYVEKRFWVVLPFHAIQHMQHLKLAPCGVVPQRERRPRPIIDYTFAGVNQNSVRLAPMHSMQFGNALQRILQRLAYANPKFGPVHMLKFDLSDGYYRIRLSPEAALELAVLIPGDTPNASLVGIPLSLPMGWAQSPPYFCAYTETAADLANSALGHPMGPPHNLEIESQYPAEVVPIPQAKAVEQHYVSPPGKLLATPVQFTDVYMDDFIALAQPPLLQNTLHHTLHGILQVFRDQPLPTDPAARRHIISQSKIERGDATWGTEKVILGWLLNSAAGTLRLQPHKAARLQTLTQEFSTKNRTSRKKWQRLLGEFRYMATAIPGAKYLFSLLQHVFKDQPNSARFRLGPLVKQALLDWGDLAADLDANPMPIASLVPRAPHYVGAVDASGTGCGGFWVGSSFGSLTQPTAFRLSFPNSIRRAMVSTNNPLGTLTNSDFELAALVLGAAILPTIAPTPHYCAYAASDNTPAVAWCNKGSTSSAGANAHLLRWLAHLTRQSRLTLQPISVPGTSNTIADFISRSFSLSDQDLQNELNSRFPYQHAWQIAHPTPEHEQYLISALSKTTWQQRCATPGKEGIEPQRPCGTPSATPCTSTPPCPTVTTRSQRYSSSPIDTALESLLPAALVSAVKRWGMPFVPWGRRSPSWDCQTPASRQRGNWTSAFPNSLPPTTNQTHRQQELSPSRCQFFNTPSTVQGSAHPLILQL